MAFVDGARPLVAVATSTGIGVWDEEARAELVRLRSQTVYYVLNRMKEAMRALPARQS